MIRSLVTFAVFMLVRLFIRWRREPAPSEPTTKACPMCCTKISIAAIRCPACTSELVK